MKRVTGIGGIFFKARDAGKLRDWYRNHLGIEAESDGGFTFEWREAGAPDKVGQTLIADEDCGLRHFSGHAVLS